AQFGPHAPPLMYCGQAAIRRGARIQPMYWRPPSGRKAADLGLWVHSEVVSVLDAISGVAPGVKPLLIGKSLASHAATIAAERGLPAIWLTPLLTIDSVCA